MRLQIAIIAIIASCWIAIVGQPVLAVESCPRGDLDMKYCDRDGDMVADVPTDPKQLIDPDTLIFAYTPLEDPAVYAEMWRGFLSNMEKVTHKKVKLFQVQSNAAQFEALRSGRLHITGANTGGVPIAVNCSGFVPFAMMSSPDQPFASHTEIIVPMNSTIQTAKDLKGRTIAFTSPTSNSGYKTPIYLLEKEFGLKADVDYKSKFSGKHENSILGITNGDFEAAAVADVVLRPLARRKVYEPSQIRTIYRSGAFPTTGYGYAYNLTPALVEKIKQAFLTYKIDADPNLRQEFPDQTRFIPIAYKKDWETVRQVDSATGVKYDCK